MSVRRGLQRPSTVTEIDRDTLSFRSHSWIFEHWTPTRLHFTLPVLMALTALLVSHSVDRTALKWPTLLHLQLMILDVWVSGSIILMVATGVTWTALEIKVVIYVLIYSLSATVKELFFPSISPTRLWSRRNNLIEIKIVLFGYFPFSISMSNIQ